MRASTTAPSHSQPQGVVQESKAKKVFRTLVHHAKKHVGAGILCSVAYFDPGNWSVDLQAGSEFGYKLLFVVLASGLCAVVLQVMAAKLGCVTGLDLASHCRLLLGNHPKYPRLVRWLTLYPLYILSEVAIISTDLAELLGSAIGLVLIFPKLPLSVAVLLTALDVIFILAFDPKQQGKPLRLLELLIIVMVAVVFCCFIVLIIRVSPHWPDVFHGYLPSGTLVQPDGLYSSIGILGATVMPHALFLGSRLSTQDRVSEAVEDLEMPASTPGQSRRSVKAFVSRLFAVGKSAGDQRGDDLVTPYGVRENKPLSFVKAHLAHGIADMVLSLLGFAVAINSAILVLAGAVFFYGPGKSDSDSAAGLFDCHRLLTQLVGKPAAFIFALALLCAGQSASLTATLAGQIVSEGFIQWTISPFLRRLITRLIGLVPSMAVAVAVGRNGIDSLLVISQVILSIVLPFVVFPLVYLTSSKTVMRVKKPRVPIEEISYNGSEKDVFDGKPRGVGVAIGMQEEIVVDSLEDVQTMDRSGTVTPSLTKSKWDKEAEVRSVSSGKDEDEDEYVDYSNGWVMTILAYAIWVVIVLANGYLLITLAMGED